MKSFGKVVHAIGSKKTKNDLETFEQDFELFNASGRALLEKYQEIMLNNGGIPHWGKTNNILDSNPGHLKKLYPKLEVWKSVIKKFNPNGTFNNVFSDRLKLTD